MPIDISFQKSSSYLTHPQIKRAMMFCCIGNLKKNEQILDKDQKTILYIMWVKAESREEAVRRLLS